MFTVQELSCFYRIVDPPSDDWWQRRTEENQDTGEVCGWGESHDLIKYNGIECDDLMAGWWCAALCVCVFSVTLMRSRGRTYGVQWRAQITGQYDSLALSHCISVDFLSTSSWLFLILDCKTFSAVLLKLVMNFNWHP